MITHLLNFFIVTKSQIGTISASSAGGNFCWNYATGTFYGSYAGDNVCCIYAGFEVVLFVTGMLMDLSVAIMQLEASGVHKIPPVIMQVVFSAVHYAHDCFCCNYAGDSFFYSHVGDGFKL